MPTRSDDAAAAAAAPANVVTANTVTANVVTANTVAANTAAANTASSPGVFANRSFRLLFFGTAISGLGDQFTIVALPWLVLKLTGKSADLGLVLAAIGLPRAVFILIGGAIVDRLSPRRVLLVADAVNALLIAVLAVLTLAHAINIQMIYVLAVGVGLATAFAYPAGNAILPRLVDAEQLPVANSLFMSLQQLCLLVGPVVAGFVILGATGAGAHTEAVAQTVAGAQPASHDDLRGIAVAFGVDTASFLASLVLLFMVQVRGGQAKDTDRSGGLRSEVGAGLRAVWADVQLRAFLFYGAVASIFLGGALQVGLPVLSNSRLHLGAASLGLLLAANGAGFLVGSLFSATVGRVVRGRLGVMVLCLDCLAGISVASLAVVQSTLGGVGLILLTGVLQGVVQVAIVTWIQMRVAPELMGRTMSIVMFTFMGLAPLSAMIAGALLKIVSVATLFAGGGIGLTLTALFCLTRRQVRRIEMPLTAMSLGASAAVVPPDLP